MSKLDGYQTVRLVREQLWGHAVRLIALTDYGQGKTSAAPEKLASMTTWLNPLI